VLFEDLLDRSSLLWHSRIIDSAGTVQSAGFNPPRAVVVCSVSYTNFFVLRGWFFWAWHSLTYVGSY